MNNGLTALECIQAVIDHLSAKYCSELSKTACNKNGVKFCTFSTEAGERLADFSRENRVLPPRVIACLFGYLMTMDNDEYYRKLMNRGDTQKLKEILADYTAKSHDLLNIALLMKAAREMRL